MRNNRILFFIFSVNGGGAAKILLRLVEKYSKYKEIHLVTLEEPDGTYLMPENIRVQVLNISRSGLFSESLNYYFNMILELRSKFKAIHPERIISFIHVANVITIISNIGLSSRVIVCERSDIQKTRIHPFWKKIRSIAYFFAYKIVLQNDSDIFKLPLYVRKKTIVAGNPVAEIIPANESVQNRLLSIGRLHAVKRYDLIISLLESILKDDPSLEYWIFGEGPLKSSIEELIRQKKLDNQIFLKGHSTKLENIIYSSVALLMASESEGQPNAMIEASILGVPSICFGTSECFHELAKFFDNIQIIEEGDLEGYTMKLKEIISKKRHQARSDEIRNSFENWNRYAYSSWEQILLDGENSVGC